MVDLEKLHSHQVEESRCAAPLAMTSIAPFEPKIYNERGYLFYGDGRVWGAVDELDWGGLKISEWGCIFEGKGCTTMALAWIREQGYSFIVVDQIVERAAGYWRHLLAKGLVEELFDEDGVALGSEPDNHVPS